MAVYAELEQDLAATTRLGETEALARLPPSAVSVDGQRFTVAIAPQDLSESSGFLWDKQTYARQYKVGTEMYKYAYSYDRCPPSAPYYRGWEAGKFSGNYGENSGISRPSWGTCRKQTSSGWWWREVTNGKSFRLGGGLKFRKVLGFDLSTNRQYSTESKLAYYTTAGRWLCGNNDVPDSAGKVMESTQDVI